MSEAPMQEEQRILLCPGCYKQTTVLMSRDEAIKRTGSYMNVPEKYHCECGSLKFKVIDTLTPSSLLDAIIKEWPQEVN